MAAYGQGLDKNHDCFSENPKRAYFLHLGVTIGLKNTPYLIFLATLLLFMNLNFMEIFGPDAGVPEKICSPEAATRMCLQWGFLVKAVMAF